jgi:hypothetical protein
MSDIKRWMKIMESVPTTFPNQPDPHELVKRDATVMVDPRVGGGSGRYMHGTDNGAMIDIKGVARELAGDDFSTPERDYEDPYEKGNDWFHMSIEPDTIGSLKDKPEFRPGDMVKIADVYGAVIGPGFGIFVAYGTTGQDCIISFDNKQIIVPTANVGSVVEQNAKDNFDQIDNDGALSPMSLGSENVKIEQPQNSGIQSREPEMDQRDEFAKWIGMVEEALTSESGLDINMLPQQAGCDCGAWDCTVCFPDETMVEPQGAACPACGHVHDEMEHGSSEFDMEPQVDDVGFDIPVDETDMDFNEVPAQKPSLERGSNGGVKLGNIVQKYVPAGQESPLTHGNDLEEDDGNWYEPEASDFDEPDYDADPIAARERDGQMASAGEFAAMGDADMDSAEDMMSSIMSMQQMGLSKSSQMYQEADFQNMGPSELKRAYDEVMGTVSEDDMMQDPAMDMGMGAAPAGGGQYAPGTAPTMPESVNYDKAVAQRTAGIEQRNQARKTGAPYTAPAGNHTLKTVTNAMRKQSTQGNNVMENVDKDVAAMLGALKRYDTLKESVAPVLGMVTLNEKGKKPDFLDADKDGDKKESFKKAVDDKKNGESDSEGGEIDESKKVNEGADPEILEWMQRFSKLGNMKGYGK